MGIVLLLSVINIFKQPLGTYIMQCRSSHSFSHFDTLRNAVLPALELWQFFPDPGLLVLRAVVNCYWTFFLLSSEVLMADLDISNQMLFSFSFWHMFKESAHLRGFFSGINILSELERAMDSVLGTLFHVSCLFLSWFSLERMGALRLVKRKDEVDRWGRDQGL